MQTHELKIWPLYFVQVESGRKTFECRKMDRDFKTGDQLYLREYDAGAGQYTGRAVYKTIGCILTGEQFGIMPGFCVLSLMAPYTGLRSF